MLILKSFHNFFYLNICPSNYIKVGFNVYNLSLLKLLY